MKIRVWNAELPPFPREGLNHLLPSEECPAGMLLKSEAFRLARLSQFDPPENLAALKRFQKKLRSALWKKFGTVYDGSLPLEPEYFGTVSRPGFTVSKVIYQSRPGLFVTALLYVPEGEGPFPGVIHMHGHNIEGKFAERVQAASLALVGSGYVCLAVDAFGTYERATAYRALEYHGGFLGSALLNIGESLMGGQVVDNMRGVDFLCSLPFVKKERIGATGASGGGNQTMWLAAMDERIAAAMPVVSVGSFESYVSGVNCVCELLPDGLTFTDEAGVLALIAPRPLRIGNALFDVNPTFSVAEMLKTYHQVEELYWKLGVPDRIACTVANRVHGMMDEQREAVLGWFDCHLKGLGGGNPRPEPEYELMPEPELWMFAEGETRPEKIRPIDVHCRLTGGELRARMLACESFGAAERRRALSGVLRLRPTPRLAAPRRYADVGGVERYALDTGERLIPILLRRGASAGKFRILLDPKGKAVFSDAEVAAAGADGSTVVLFDLFGSGESARPNPVLGDFHQLFRQLLWIGRSLPGEWVFDLFSVVRMLERFFGAGEISVVARREAGVCSVFAAALSGGKFKVEAVDAPASFLFRRDSIPLFDAPVYKAHVDGGLYSPMLSLPGFLRWGDLSLAAALAGDAVTFVSPRAYDGTPLTGKEIAAFDDERRLLAGRLRG